MEIFISIILIILVAILFSKVSQLKKLIDYQDLKIKNLQEQLNKQAQTFVKKPEETKSEHLYKKAEPIIEDKIIEQPQPAFVQNDVQNQQKSTTKTQPIKKEHKETAFDQFINQSVAFVKDNFLTVFGIVTLVLGIAYFVKYAIDQNWINETFRVIIGVVVGLSIIGVAHRIRKNFEIFSSILIGGGLTVLYFTLTIAFREYHILSQNLTFTLLTLVTIFSIVLAFLYNRQILAIFSIIGGFCAPLMISTGESNFVFLFGYLVLLNLSMLFMSWRKNWQVINYIAFFFTTMYSLAWIDKDHTQVQLIYFVLLYLIFSITSLIQHFQKNNFSVGDCILYSINTILSTVLISSIYYSKTDYPGLITFIFGLINAVFAAYIYTTSKNKLLLNTLIGLCIALITTAIGIEFDANITSICFAIESSLLLFLWKKSGENIFKVFFIIMFPFLLLFLCINWFDYINTETRLPVLFNKVFITSFFVFICSIVNIYLMRDFETEEQFLGFKINHSKFIFISTSILLMYAGILFEFVYQIEPYYSTTLIASYVLIYTLFFIAFILVLRRYLKLGRTLQYTLLVAAIGCIFFLPIFADLPNEANQANFRISSYIIYLSYLIPTCYFIYLVINQGKLLRTTSSQIIMVLVLVYIISFEMYNSFMIATLQPTTHNFSHQQDIYTMILLPILWAIMGFGLIYFGLRKQLKGLPLVGILLFGLIILKLYFIDVWQMSNIFRIVSFIVLGILILITSFMYQKLKNLMKNLMEQPNENKEAES